jgi:hypothetical protein
MLSPVWLSTFIGAAFAPPAKTIAIASAVSGDGSRMQNAGDHLTDVGLPA